MNTTTKQTAGTLYQDAMDRTRVLRIVQFHGSHVEAKVYWRGRNGSLAYGGRISVASKLFGEDSMTQSVGFFPVDKPATTNYKRPFNPRNFQPKSNATVSVPPRNGSAQPRSRGMR